MESQPINSEFRINSESFHPWNYKPVCEILVLTANVSSGISDKPVQKCSLNRAFTAGTHKVGT